MKKAIVLLALPVLLFSCNHSKEDMLAKKWRAISVVNPGLDSMIASRETFIDTFGKNNDPATNKEMYGFSNVDSIRESLRAEWKDVKDMQKHAVENTWFDFKKEGTVVMNFSGQMDSTKWSLTKEGQLMLEENKSKPNAISVKMDIVELTDNSLKLRYNDQGGTSTVSFKPDGK